MTGANGFVAMWLVRKLLERGFSVRGTVRSESKIAQLKQVFAEFGDKFEGVIVEDITKVRKNRLRNSAHTHHSCLLGRSIRRGCQGH